MSHERSQGVGMKQQWRVGIVSATGTGAKRTIPALTNSAIVTVTAVHGRDPVRLKQLADRYAIGSTYTDLPRMIDERLFDFVIVCSPPFLHEEQVTQLLLAGIPCLIEKPAGLSAHAVEKLLTLSRQTKTKVRVAHHLRYAPIFKTVRRILERGDLGLLHTASMEWSFRLNRAAKSAKWKLDPALNGLTCLTDAGIHCLDIALALFGRGKLKTVIPEEDRTDRTIEEVVLISSHGKVSVSTTCSRRYGPYSNSLRVAGTDGEIVVPEFFGESPAIKGIIYLNKTRKTIRANANNPYQLEVEDFAAILSGDDGLGVAATLDEALEVALVVDDVASQIASIRPER